MVLASSKLAPFRAKEKPKPTELRENLKAKPWLVSVWQHFGYHRYYTKVLVTSALVLDMCEQEH